MCSAGYVALEEEEEEEEKEEEEEEGAASWGPWEPLLPVAVAGAGAKRVNGEPTGRG